jgi:hypothetical protein
MTQQSHSLSTFDGFERVREFVVTRGAGSPPIRKLRRFPDAVAGKPHGRGRVMNPAATNPANALAQLNGAGAASAFSPFAWIEADAFVRVHGYDQPPRDYTLSEAVVAELDGDVVAAFAVFDAPSDPGATTHTSWFYAAFIADSSESSIDLDSCTFTDVSGELRPAPGGGALAMAPPAAVSITAFERLVRKTFTQRFTRWQRIETIRSIAAAPASWF